ncbi:hypothetical protein IGL76_001164 [Enterococcus sp. DIV2381]
MSPTKSKNRIIEKKIIFYPIDLCYNIQDKGEYW